MALSVLRVNPYSDNFVVYSSKQQKAILLGTEEECWDWKNCIDESERKQANQTYFDELRVERTALLVSSGHTEETATEFLQKQMPYLFKQ